ncbi:hypothetical protein NLX86_12175 [Streptomyces sp. A3M-1-3]|uniref:hypothetical protein n=1 Tax=Streptomyces sp. A3M-1-3 TaxID=2962044 RepID=UPI0020B776D6|nr:hypothetical protein [Streptomyces sp. A3M-1-3]MCP3818838.1 hypothetical protein [Streptomyces sp. A3M-1-3]
MTNRRRLPPAQPERLPGEGVRTGARGGVRGLGVRGVVAALVASLCCTGPLLLIAVGAGTGLLSGAGRVLPVYAPLAGGLLMLGFLAWEVRRRGGSFTLAGLRRARSVIISGLLVFATAWLVMTTAVTPWLAETLTPSTAATTTSRPAADYPGPQRPLELRIDGMYCPACVAVMKTQLRDVEGIVNVEKVWTGGARLTYDPNLVSAEEIRQAATFGSFTARIEP